MPSETIEALLRAVDRFFNAHNMADRYDAECLLGAAAAAVRAELAREPVACSQCGEPFSAAACGPTHAMIWHSREPVELSDNELDDAYRDAYVAWFGADSPDAGSITDNAHWAGLRAVARAARGESK